jgi:cob(I)alamin adenosyltransferase
MIYTKTGDNGTTSLANGERVSKTDPRIEAYGTADELNSYFGWLRALLEQVGNQPSGEVQSGVSVHISQLAVVQNKLFNLGAMLSCAPGQWITPADVTEVEHWIDAIQAELPPQHAFILPAGSEAIAAAHICRTVTRRLERLMVNLAQDGKPNAPETASDDLAVAVRWVNRLSDFCFVLARKCAIFQKKSPIEWKK